MVDPNEKNTIEEVCYSKVLVMTEDFYMVYDQVIIVENLEIKENNSNVVEQDV